MVLLRPNWDDALLALYHGARALPDSTLPTNPNEIVKVADTTPHKTICAQFAMAPVVVMLPGEYCRQGAPLTPPYRKVEHIVGIGRVVVKANPETHSVYVGPGRLVLSGLSFEADLQPRYSAVSTDMDSLSNVSLVDCSFVNYPEVGLLVVSGCAFVSRCVFTACSKQAIEVREGGTLIVTQTNISNCHQGLNIYGGARRAAISYCSISACAHEGILVSGSLRNAATRDQADAAPHVNRNTFSQQADEWGISHAIPLDVEISYCKIKGCLSYGASLDNGAIVNMRMCTLDDNRPYAVFIKGETSVRLVACLLQCKDPAEEGVHVGINYKAEVVIAESCFHGFARGRAVYEECALSNTTSKRATAAGFRSRPVTQKNVTFLSKGGVTVPPSIADLRAQAVASGQAALSAARTSMASLPPSLANAGLCRTARRMIASDTNFYAVGNTFGFSVMETSAQGEHHTAVSVLFAACGDVRNLIRTIADCCSRPFYIRAQ